LCKESAPVTNSGICQCLNFERDNYNLISQSFIFGFRFGFQTSFWRKTEGFYFKLDGVFGGAYIFPDFKNRELNVICPELQEVVDNREMNTISSIDALGTNHTVQFEKTVRTYFTLNIKLGYAF